MRVACCKILGWKQRLSVPPYELHMIHGEMTDPTAEREGIPCWDSPEGQYYCQSPNFPTNPTAALTLCDWMAERGWGSKHKRYILPSLWEWTFTKFVTSRQVEEHTHTAPTFPLAVTGAFLRANGIKPSTEQREGGI